MAHDVVFLFLQVSWLLLFRASLYSSWAFFFLFFVLSGFFYSLSLFCADGYFSNSLFHCLCDYLLQFLIFWDSEFFLGFSNQTVPILLCCPISIFLLFSFLYIFNVDGC